MDAVGGAEDENVSPAANSSHLCESQMANATEKFVFVSSTCSPNKEALSENVAPSVSVIPGGYLQTLLEASDSSGSTGIPFFPQQTQHSLDLSLVKQQFTSTQLVQSCVLSPPSESELQQSPPELSDSHPDVAPPSLGPNQQFATADIAESAIKPSSFTGEMAMPLSESLTVSGYSQLSLESNRMLYEIITCLSSRCHLTPSFRHVRGNHSFKEPHCTPTMADSSVSTQLARCQQLLAITAL